MAQDDKPILVALSTQNPHKLEEIRTLLQSCPIELHPLKKWRVRSARETASTFVENAILKARHACTRLDLPAIADDSGLVVPALGGAPGIRSARFAEDGASAQQNNRMLLSLMFGGSSPVQDTSAYFHSVLVYMGHKDEPDPIIAFGTWHGRIVEQPRGSNGFGYDPLFVPDGGSLTAAELDTETKNRLSHRGQAATRFVEQLNERLAR